MYILSKFRGPSYETIGLICWVSLVVLSSYICSQRGDWDEIYMVGLIFSIGGAAAFFHGVLTLEPRHRYPILQLVRWWHEFATPATVNILEDGRMVLVRWWCSDLAEVYDKNGQRLGSLWVFKHLQGGRMFEPKYERDRLPWLARLRSPKLPSERGAEVIDHENKVVGHTTYNIR